MRILTEELPGHDDGAYWKTICRILIYIGGVADRV